MQGWKRVSECKVCGKSDCVESTVNNRAIYCYRFGKIYYKRADGTTSAQNKQQTNKQKDKDQMTLFQLGKQYGDD